MTIVVSQRTLTDNSHVYDVIIGNVSLAAVTEADAFDMARKFRDAIIDHTNDAADVQTDY